MFTHFSQIARFRSLIQSADPGHVVRSNPVSGSLSPEIGNIAEDTQRFSTQQVKKISDFGIQRQSDQRKKPVCTESLNPNIKVMKPAEYRA